MIKTKARSLKMLDVVVLTNTRRPWMKSRSRAIIVSEPVLMQAMKITANPSGTKYVFDVLIESGESIIVSHLDIIKKVELDDDEKDILVQSFCRNSRAKHGDALCVFDEKAETAIPIRELLCDIITFDSIRSEVDEEVEDFAVSSVIHRLRKKIWARWPGDDMPSWATKHRGENLLDTVDEEVEI